MAKFCNRVLSLILLAWLMLCASAASAATCSPATTQGTAPSSWQTYCWIDFSTYSDTTARSASGQNFSITLSDGAVLSFNVKVSGNTTTAIAAPSWTGAAVGNTAFLGIPGQPILYQNQSTGISTFTISSILITPPPGVPAVTAYALVAADAESTDNSEALTFTTNGGNWTVLDQVPPISGSNYPTISGAGTNSFTANGGGVTGNTGAWIVGSNSPTTVTATVNGAGLQGAMFAVRFASIRLNKQIVGARADPADQFTFEVRNTSSPVSPPSGTILASGVSSGTSLGPFTAAGISLASGINLTLDEKMAAGSTYDLTHYQAKITCTNDTLSSTTPLPTLATPSADSASAPTVFYYNFGALAFGDAVQCTFINTPMPHLKLVKALGASGRFANTDQFVMNLSRTSGTPAVVATTTTGGTGATLTSASTAQFQATAGQTYSFNEAASGTTVLSNYAITMNCVNASSATPTVLPTAAGGSITPMVGDVITCTITNTVKFTAAKLTITKVSQIISDPISGTTNPKAIPGAVVRYDIIITNIGKGPVDLNTVVLTDPLPANVTYHAATPVSFTNGATASGLNTFNAATMVTYSSAVGGGTPFTYAPSTTGYDANVKGLRIAPTGTMAAATAAGTPSFTVSFLTRIN